MNELEAFCTELYLQGTQPSPEKAQQLLSELSSLYITFTIKSVLDCGCGSFPWPQDSSIPILCIDIVESLLEEQMETYKDSTQVQFQKLNVCTDPPETKDLWIARDLLSMMTYEQINLFFQKFLESKSKYIGITSIETSRQNTDTTKGILRPLAIDKHPFFLKRPLHILQDGQQWFKKKTLNIYSREQIQMWIDTEPFTSKSEDHQQNMQHDTQDKNVLRGSNIPLRQRSLYDHTV